jgi:NitT/TauT family transport system substrate-binding protein
MFQLLVGDLGSPSYFVATAAVSLGFFADEGIEMAPVRGSKKNAEGLDDGSAHFFAGPAYGALDLFPEFAGVKLLCALSQYSYWFMGIRTDLDIRRGDIQALKGLRISSSTSAPGKGLRHMLVEGGIDFQRDNVRIVNSPSTGKNKVFRGNDGIIALQQDIADAFWGNGMRLEMAVRLGLAKLHIDLRRGDGPPGARFYNFPALVASESFVLQNPTVAAGAVRAIVKTQKALKADPSLARKVGDEVFPAEEAELITLLVERDAPYYQADISHEAVDGLNRFCVTSGLLRAQVPYEMMVATQFKSLWN